MEQDKERYKRFVDGDISAFEELVLNHKDKLIYFLTRYVKDFHVCEDIAQELFATIFVKKQKSSKKIRIKKVKQIILHHAKKFWLPLLHL